MAVLAAPPAAAAKQRASMRPASMHSGGRRRLDHSALQVHACSTSRISATKIHWPQSVNGLSFSHIEHIESE